MTKIQIRTDNVEGFFKRAKRAAVSADQSLRTPMQVEAFSETVTLSFEDPSVMFKTLSEARRQLLGEILNQSRTIAELSQTLKRNRSSISKDVSILENAGLLISTRQSNPGHGIQKSVRAIAPRIEMRAILG